MHKYSRSFSKEVEAVVDLAVSNPRVEETKLKNGANTTAIQQLRLYSKPGQVMRKLHTGSEWIQYTFRILYQGRTGWRRRRVGIDWNGEQFRRNLSLVLTGHFTAFKYKKAFEEPEKRLGFSYCIGKTCLLLLSFCNVRTFLAIRGHLQRGLFKLTRGM